METKIIYDLPESEYHSDRARISYHGIKEFQRTPAHFYAAYLDPNAPPRDESKALIDGSIHHMALLEPGKFEATYLRLDDTDIINEIGGARPRTTKRYSEWLEYSQVPGKTNMIATEYDRFMAMARAVQEHPMLRDLLPACETEVSAHWVCPGTGVECRSRADLVHADFIADYKTCEDASDEAISRAVWNYGYAGQAEMYMTAFRKTIFILIFQEKKYPYLVNVKYLTADQDYVKYYTGKRIATLRRYTECLKSGVWPGYQPTPDTMRVMPPSWVKLENL